MNSPSNHYEGVWDANALAVVTCSALALYNALELELLVLTTFSSFSGLYFTSLVLASLGIIPYVLGFMIEYFRLSWMALGIALDTVGWSLMVTGQSVVLYSRLWLVFGPSHRRLLNAVKWMIMIDGLLFHGLTAIVVYGSHYGSRTKEFGKAYDVIERVQMIGFCLQEFVLSGLYIWKALDIINTTERKRSHHHVLWQLFSINVVIIVLDVGLLTLEFMSFHVLQQTVKGFVYSVKLKLEFAVLSKLIELSHPSGSISAFTVGDESDFVDLKKIDWDTTRQTPAFSGMRSCPRWMSDLEKSGIQRIESVYSPTESTWANKRPQVTSDEVEECHDAIQPVSNSRVQGTATDLLYADAVRRIAG